MGIATIGEERQRASPHLVHSNSVDYTAEDEHVAVKYHCRVALSYGVSNRDKRKSDRIQVKRASFDGE